MAELEKKRGRNPVPPHIAAQIFMRFKQLRKQGEHVMPACEIIAKELGENFSVKTVWGVVDRLRPTDQLASVYLKSQAMRLAIRLVKQADAAQAMELLSRPSIGVIAPKARENSGGGDGGFFLSVQVDSCGAVKVG